MRATFFTEGETGNNFVCGICLREFKEAWDIVPITDYEFETFRKLGFETGSYFCSDCYLRFGKDLKKLIKLIKQKQKADTKHLK